jgi:CHAD domain-containing protein
VPGVGGPDSTIEREVKLDAGLRFELPELTGILPGVVATRLPNAKLQAIYVDTVDLRLMRWGVTLRHRRDVVGGAGAESGWTVKLPMDADGVALVRNELSWPGAFGPVPAEVAAMVRAQARTARLVPVAKLLTERHRVDLRDSAGRKLGEIDDDVVSVMDGRRLAARFRQVELEVTDAAPDDLLEEVLQALTVAGAVAGDDRPKVVRAIGPRASLGPDVVVPTLDANSTVATVVAAAIAAGVTRIVRHDPGVRLGDDPEHVHQARVGTRRLRSDLRTFWRLLDANWARPIRDELGWLAAVLGEVRDADVLTGRLRRQIRTLGGVDAKASAALLRRLATQREEARVRLLEALNSDRYLVLLEALSEAAAHPPLAPPEPTSPPIPAVTSESGRSFESGASSQSLRSSESGASSQSLRSSGAGGSSVSALSVASAGAQPAPSPTTGPGGPYLGSGEPPAGPAPVLGGPPNATWATDGAGPGTNGSEPLPLTLVVARSPAAGAAWAARGRADDSSPGLGGERAADVLPALVRRPWKHMQQAVDHLGADPADEALHEIRIRSKRMRYAAEAVAGVIGKPARQLAAAVAEVQGVLGDMQDAVVAEEWLRRQASSGPASQALVAGELITYERQKQAECRETWETPWKAASKKSLRKWLSA